MQLKHYNVDMHKNVETINSNNVIVTPPRWFTNNRRSPSYLEEFQTISINNNNVSTQYLTIFSFL